MSVQPTLETRGLSRRFGGLDAVADVSVQVEPGTVLGVMGPNGAGKSTFINLVTGHIKPTAGSVLIGGRDVTGAKPWVVAGERVARTFQIVKPFRGLTVRENVAIGLMFGTERKSATAAAGLADAVLDRVGLLDRAEDAPAALSVADARRLELGKALALRPKLLLLDEVMAGLRHNEIDPALALIRSLRAEGVTIVAVEHVMKAILSISDQILVLHHGRQLTYGTPEEVVADERVIEAYLGERYARRMRAERAEREAAEAAKAPDGGGGDA
jgi:branched-chain amino acid transport system ATP-binding protein